MITLEAGRSRCIACLSLLRGAGRQAWSKNLDAPYARSPHYHALPVGMERKERNACLFWAESWANMKDNRTLSTEHDYTNIAPFRTVFTGSEVTALPKTAMRQVAVTGASVYGEGRPVRLLGSVSGVELPLSHASSLARGTFLGEEFT